MHRLIMSNAHRPGLQRRASRLSLAMALALSLPACIQRTAGPATETPAGNPGPAASDAASSKGASTAPPATLPEGASIAKKYADYFTVGVAVTQKHLTTPAVRDVIETHFN